MIDPLISLAFSICAKKGTYALLLGSGLSRSSGIPTGWEVVLDLIERVAKLSGADCGPDPAAWYTSTNGEEPNYSKLLGSLAKTAPERQQILRGYFEPTEEERAQNRKVPTAGHRAIAKLIASGHIRVVVTTNFDRLLEVALQEVGIVPSVISNSDDISGALPLVHSDATIIKIHGDYVDCRIRNTESEVGTYEPALNALLDRVFDEYGLVVAGWSADWDHALRAAIQRCPSRRFSTFWTTRDHLSESAKKVADSRKAEIIRIKDADGFFQELWEKVQALSDLDSPHPMSDKMAIATVKRYLVDSTARIRLRDLVHEETEKLVSNASAAKFPPTSTNDVAKELILRLQRYEAISGVMMGILVTGCYWSDRSQASLWVKALTRIANAPLNIGGTVYLHYLQNYPALLLFYAGGLASLAADKYETLNALFNVSVSREGKSIEAVAHLHTNGVFRDNLGKLLPGMAGQHVPVSEYLCKRLREPFREYLPDDETYEELFDRFEYLLGLTHANLVRNTFGVGWWGPLGCFVWRRRFGGGGMPALIAAEFNTSLGEWPPLKGGMFGGSVEQARNAIGKFNEFLASVPL